MEAPKIDGSDLNGNIHYSERYRPRSSKPPCPVDIRFPVGHVGKKTFS